MSIMFLIRFCGIRYGKIWPGPAKLGAVRKTAGIKSPPFYFKGLFIIPQYYDVDGSA
jgi:hypothetical protein